MTTGEHDELPVLAVNPATDEAFRTMAEDALRHLHRRAPADLQRLLRVNYPNAVARARDLHGEAVAVWYVYREGHWVSPSPKAA
jgi:hypothetical protein